MTFSISHFQPIFVWPGNTFKKKFRPRILSKSYWNHIKCDKNWYTQDFDIWPLLTTTPMSLMSLLGLCRKLKVPDWSFVFDTCEIPSTYYIHSLSPKFHGTKVSILTVNSVSDTTRAELKQVYETLYPSQYDSTLQGFKIIFYNLS